MGWHVFHRIGVGGLLVVMVSGCASDVLNTEQILDVGWEFQDTSGVWREARVPGSIHTDLMGHGLLESPFFAQNEAQVQWVEDQNWSYRCALPGPPEEGVWSLEFAGLDTYADVMVNGTLVLSADNMYRSWRIPEADLGLTGQDSVLVVLKRPVLEGQLRLDASPWPIPVSNENRPIGRQTSAVTRKAMYHYGWDWGPRLVTSGIWKPVRWVRTDIELPPFRLQAVSVDTVRAEYDVIWDEPVGPVTFRMSLSGETALVQQTDAPSDVHRLVIDRPQLWWPNGMGGQPLYELEIEDRNGRKAKWRFGVRTLVWNRSPDAFGQPMQCVVNGVPVQVVGANVIPPDFFPVRAEKQWGRVVDDAVQAHMNMLRVWGGAHYGDEAFYDLCDERGILVWQDFMSACAMVPGDAAWRDNFLAEAEEQVRRLRNRTSLAIWAGNNETEKAWRDWGWQDTYGLHGADSIAAALAYRRVFEKALPAVVEALSGGEYQPSSPHNVDVDRPRASGDQHDWGVWFGKAGFEYYTEEAGRFASEFGMQSLPDRRTLESVGVRNFDDPRLQFRQRCKMDWLEPGFDGWDMMRHYASAYFADPESIECSLLKGFDRLDVWTYLTQLTQAEGLRQAVERHRSSGGRTSGSLYWQLDDVWPTVSWSTVDHSGRWKLAHHAVRHANQPVRLVPDRSTGNRLTYQIINSSLETVQGELLWSLVSLKGDTIHDGRRSLSLGSATYITIDEAGVEVNPKEHVFVWNWRRGGDSLQFHDRGHHTFLPAGDLNWSRAPLISEVTADGLQVSSLGAVSGVWLRSSEEGHFEDNGFTMLPGEERTVQFFGPSGVASDPGVVRVSHFGEVQASMP